MAARKKKQQTESTKDRIKAGLLMNRLENHALSDEEIMTSTQIRAAEILLRKVVPDLSHATGEIQHSFADDLSERLAMAREQSDASRQSLDS
jgi:hypothetical protein